MSKELQPRNNNGSLFAVDTLYERLVEPMQTLEDEAYVDTTLNGVALLKKGIDELYDRLFQGAGVRQERVLEQRDTKIQDFYAVVEQSRKDGDFEAYEAALLQVGEASLHAREAVGKLRYIHSRGFGEYNSKAQLTGMVRDLEKKLLEAPKKD